MVTLARELLCQERMFSLHGRRLMNSFSILYLGILRRNELVNYVTIFLALFGLIGSFLTQGNMITPNCVFTHFGLVLENNKFLVSTYSSSNLISEDILNMEYSKIIHR